MCLRCLAVRSASAVCCYWVMIGGLTGTHTSRWFCLCVDDGSDTFFAASLLFSVFSVFETCAYVDAVSDATELEVFRRDMS